MKNVIYQILQCTWGFLQTSIGLILFIIHKNDKHYLYHGAIVTEWKMSGSISLGLFIFVCERPYSYLYPGKSKELLSKMIVHEYGHTIQSLLLGPMYLIVIGLPSYLWANIQYFHKLRKQKDISYFSLYTEKSANYLGELVTKESSMSTMKIN